MTESLAEPLTDWPTEPFEKYLNDRVYEQNRLRARAMNLARFYLNHDETDAAYKALARCSKTCNEMYDEIETRRMIEAARVAGATWEEVYNVLSGFGVVPTGP